MMTLTKAADSVAAVAHPAAIASDYEPLRQRAGDCQVVLVGEASHGTHEFYEIRAELTKRLIAENGFRSLAVEADWPDALRVHRYVQGSGGEANAEEHRCTDAKKPVHLFLFLGAEISTPSH